MSNTSMTVPILPLSQAPEPAALLSLRRPDPGYRLAFVAIPVFLQDLLKTSVGKAFRTAPQRVFAPQDFHEHFLGPDELVHLNGFRALKKQVEWMAGRYAAKQLALRFLEHRPPLAHTRVAYRPKGAPYFSDDPALCLSISHSGDFAVAGMGLTPSAILGVDIEQIRPESRTTLLRTAFSPREIQALEARDDATFFRYWTAKGSLPQIYRPGIPRKPQAGGNPGRHPFPRTGVPSPSCPSRAISLFPDTPSPWCPDSRKLPAPTPGRRQAP